MLLGAGLVLAGAAVLFFAVTGTDPRTLLGPLRATTPGGAPAVGGSSGGVSGGTPGVLAAQAAIRTLVATRFPQDSVSFSVYRATPVAGTASASEHNFWNAVDVWVKTPTGALDRVAMDAVYQMLRLVPYCELCWAGQGGCTTSHDDHLHYAPLPCLAG